MDDLKQEYETAVAGAIAFTFGGGVDDADTMLEIMIRREYRVVVVLSDEQMFTGEMAAYKGTTITLAQVDTDDGRRTGETFEIDVNAVRAIHIW